MHAADYREPTTYTGQNVIVVGAGNSAVQIAAEVAETADVILASRNPVTFAPQRPLRRDMHFWFKYTGIDTLPIGHLLSRPPTSPVFDTGRYHAALFAGRPKRRAMFTKLEGNQAFWPDDTTTTDDAVILATGYTPNLNYPTELEALTDTGHPRTRKACPPPTPDSDTWDWNGNEASRPHPYAGWAATRTTSSDDSLLLALLFARYHRKKCRFERPLAERRKTGTAPVKPLDTIRCRRLRHVRGGQCRPGRSTSAAVPSMRTPLNAGV